MADNPTPLSASILKIICAHHSGLLNEGDPHRRRKKQLRPVELLRRHAKDREGMLVNVDPASDDARVLTEMAAPVGIAQHDIGSAIGTFCYWK